VDAEKRGAKVKKKLEIDPLHADTVRLAFKLALEGDGVSGRMGVKSIAKHLNERKIYTRSGGRWGVGAVHRILTRPTYIGRHEFNKRGKTKTMKPTDQVIAVPVPPLIDRETFNAVQAHLKSRNPKVASPQVVGGPTMLTGICFCADCGGAMTIHTEKSGRYRYYTCFMSARQGDTGCKGRSIPMDSPPVSVAVLLRLWLFGTQGRAILTRPPRPGREAADAIRKAVVPITRCHREYAANFADFAIAIKRLTLSEEMVSVARVSDALRAGCLSAN
jgi:hypothetical protein